MSLATCSLATIRQDIATRIAGVAGMAESPEAWWFLKDRSPVHLHFAVGVPESTPISDRQITEALVAHTIKVLFGYELAGAAGSSRLDSIDTMTTKEQAVIVAVLAAPAVPPQLYQIQQLGPTQRTPGPASWIWTEITFSAVHYFSLE